MKLWQDKTDEEFKKDIIKMLVPEKPVKYVRGKRINNV